MHVWKVLGHRFPTYCAQLTSQFKTFDYTMHNWLSQGKSICNYDKSKAVIAFPLIFNVLHIIFSPHLQQENKGEKLCHSHKDRDISVPPLCGNEADGHGYIHLRHNVPSQLFASGCTCFIMSCWYQINKEEGNKDGVFPASLEHRTEWKCPVHSEWWTTTLLFFVYVMHSWMRQAHAAFPRWQLLKQLSFMTSLPHIH